MHADNKTCYLMSGVCSLLVITLYNNNFTSCYNLLWKKDIKNNKQLNYENQ